MHACGGGRDRRSWGAPPPHAHDRTRRSGVRYRSNALRRTGNARGRRDPYGATDEARPTRRDRNGATDTTLARRAPRTRIRAPRGSRHHVPGSKSVRATPAPTPSLPHAHPPPPLRGPRPRRGREPRAPLPRRARPARRRRQRRDPPPPRGERRAVAGRAHGDDPLRRVRPAPRRLAELSRGGRVGAARADERTGCATPRSSRGARAAGVRGPSRVTRSSCTAPYYARLVAYPKAWSPPTTGVVRGTPMLVTDVRGDSRRRALRRPAARRDRDDRRAPPAPTRRASAPLAQRFAARSSTRWRASPTRASRRTTGTTPAATPRTCAAGSSCSPRSPAPASPRRWSRAATRTRCSCPATRRTTATCRATCPASSCRAATTCAW